jgi:dTDP-4-dehydrorhamnose reductase
VKLYVTGISGLLGLNVALQARDQFEVAGCYQTHPVAADGLDAAALDLTDAVAASTALRNHRPDVIIHTAGLTDVDACERDPTLARRVHVDASRTVAAVAREIGARLIHISTDHLFDGDSPLRTEDDEPSPINTYARTKLEAEIAVLDANPAALVVRTNFYGWGPPHRSSFSDWILRALEAGDELSMFDDIFFTPILVNDLADLLFNLADRDVHGILHVLGRERLSKHAFGLNAARAFALPGDQISATSVEGFPFKAPRPRDMSLSTAKLQRLLGEPPPDVHEGLTRLAALRDTGWLAEIAAAHAVVAAADRR